MIDDYVSRLKNYQSLATDLVHHVVLPEKDAIHADPDRPWHPQIETMLTTLGMSPLYSHQARATDLVRSGNHCVVATPTASGKTLIYALPVLDNLLNKPDTKALFLFPLKALAQDQLKNLKHLAGHLMGLPSPLAAIYDGDTTSWQRTKIKKNLPSVLITNPDMLHLGILPYHGNWQTFFRNLDFVIVDEVHTYRGVMGSHMAWVFRRLTRICAAYGKQPTFIFSSATIANPGELAAALTGLDVEVVDQNGGPASKRHFLFLDGQSAGGSNTAIVLLQAALARKLRTLVFTQSRKMAELISVWAANKAGEQGKRISPYRAGYLPEERRAIEADLVSGKLLAVVSTSALELGIDIGALDLCILIGYPGSIMATWQRAGRVGRAGKKSAVILIGHEDAMDQYFMRHPEEFFAMPPEAAVINPYNPPIMHSHITCAAADMPIGADESFAKDKTVRTAIGSLEHKGLLLRSEDGSTWYAPRRYPQRGVNLRGSGHGFSIVDIRTGEVIGRIDRMRAFHETHPGAVYLHKSRTYVIRSLDLETSTAFATERKVSYYTRPRTSKTTEILGVHDQKSIWSTTLSMGRLRITEQVTEYEKKSNHGKYLGTVPLDFPPLVFETEGIWFDVPGSVRQSMERDNLHFMGGIHACEHAAIGILPLLVLTDRNDLGGISIPLHPQTNQAAVFIYDGTPGGAGLCRQAFTRGQELLERTLQVIASCPCETGCPACVHSPKCGSGNRPIDKHAAREVLLRMRSGPKQESVTIEIIQEPSATTLKERTKNKGQQTVDTQNGHPGEVRDLGAYATPWDLTERPNPQRSRIKSGMTAQDENPARAARTVFQGPTMTVPGIEQWEQTRDNLRVPPTTRPPLRYGVLDIETRRSAKEVGGWNKAHKMGVSCVVVYDSGAREYTTYLQDDMDSLVRDLQAMDLMVGFNINRFDYKVLSGLDGFDFSSLPTLDILEHVHRRLGYRLSLDRLAQATLGEEKSANGLLALRWWKQGKLDKIIKYCTQDVAVTKGLYEYGRDNGYLLFTNKAKKTVRLPVDWTSSENLPPAKG
ncbi:DEAD/DEAH box helicase [Desulfoplanes sp.]